MATLKAHEHGSKIQLWKRLRRLQATLMDEGDRLSSGQKWPLRRELAELQAELGVGASGYFPTEGV